MYRACTAYQCKHIKQSACSMQAAKQQCAIGRRAHLNASRALASGSRAAVLLICKPMLLFSFTSCLSSLFSACQLPAVTPSPLARASSAGCPISTDLFS